MKYRKLYSICPICLPEAMKYCWLHGRESMPGRCIWIFSLLSCSKELFFTRHLTQRGRARAEFEAVPRFSSTLPRHCRVMVFICTVNKFYCIYLRNTDNYTSFQVDRNTRSVLWWANLQQFYLWWHVEVHIWVNPITALLKFGASL